MTTYTKRPSSTISAGSGSLTGGASVHAVTSDGSDASYIQFNDGDGFALILAGYTLGAGEIVRSVQLFMRANPQGGIVAGVQAAIGTFLAPPDVVFDYGSYISGYLLSGWTQLSGAVNARSFTQAELNALVAVVNLEASFGSGPIRVSDLWVDLVVASPPSVVVTAPTGVQGTPLPTVTWTYTQGSDGGPQSKYQVKVFSAAQYTAGGFNPSTSTATYDSGVLTGATASHTITTLLPTAGTWRAYVRVAHTVAGQDAWSSWDQEDFTTTFTPALVYSVAPVATNASGLLTVTITRNGSFHAWDTVDLERSDDAGVTWAPVRGATNIAGTNTWVTSFGADTVVVVDYEAPNGVAATYRARGKWNNSGVMITGPWQSGYPTAWSSSDVWVKNPLQPSRNLKVAVQEFPRPSREVVQGVFSVIGRVRPVVVSDVRQSRTGSVVFQTEDLAAATAFEAMLDDVSVKLLQFPAAHLWGAKYVTLGRAEEAWGHPSVDQLWRSWPVSFVEVDMPVDDS